MAEQADGPPGTDRVRVDPDSCNGCGRCLQSCPTDVFRMVELTDRSVALAVYPDDCCDCNLCVIDCPQHCITVNLAPVAYGFVSIYQRMGIDIPALPALPSLPALPGKPA